MTGISAQVSVYPLREPRLSPTIDEVVQAFLDRGLEVRPGAMSTVVLGDDDAIFVALKEAWRRAGTRGDVVMVITLSNSCSAQAAAICSCDEGK